MNSVLTSIKKLLGIHEDVTDFDVDLIMHINSVLMILTQMGVLGKNHSISSKEDVWDDIVVDIEEIEAIRTYVAMKVRTMFDPPTNSAAMTALNEVIKELEYRLYISRDSIGNNPDPVLRESF